MQQQSLADQDVTDMKIKAAVLNKMGVEAPYAKSKPLAIEEVELDDPGHGEVLVRIAAAGLCHSDLSVIEGHPPRPTPVGVGHGAAGTGQRRLHRNGAEVHHHLGVSAFAEYATLSRHSLVKIEKGLPLDEAAL